MDLVHVGCFCPRAPRDELASVTLEHGIGEGWRQKVWPCLWLHQPWVPIQKNYLAARYVTKMLIFPQIKLLHNLFGYGCLVFK